LYLAGLVGWVERGPFTAARLTALQDALRADGVAPSRRLAELAALVGRIDAVKNQYFGLIAPFLLWTTRTALAVEDWRRTTGPALRRWAAVVGEAEALAALATYAAENPTDTFPELVPDGPLYEAVGLGHPLLPRDRCVPNELALNDELRLLIVSGSNMAGKSTLLRAVGVNAVLAQAGAPVRAARLRLSPLAVGATLRVLDSLQSGRSRFFAEILRLRQIVALSEGPRPVLFLLDEILHGTNSHDRRLGTAAVLRGLLRRPAIGLVTTHDLALTAIADELAPHAANVHFADEFVNGELHFDYRLRPGVVQHSNALALMRAVGLEVEG
jgi:DNA mismatch repair ATPase MutS